MDGSRVILAAHRGDKFNYPENTMPAFESAIRLGCDMIETDVRMTRDGVLVLIHDRSTLRTTGVERFVDELTYDELCELDDYKNRFGIGTLPAILILTDNGDLTAKLESPESVFAASEFIESNI